MRFIRRLGLLGGDDRHLPWMRPTERAINMRAHAIHETGFWYHIDHCPWSGTRLPEPLIGEFFKLAEDELGIEGADLPQNERKLPEDMRSDAWWRNRSQGELQRLKFEPPPRTEIEDGPPPRVRPFIVGLNPAYRPQGGLAPHADDLGPPLPHDALDENEYELPGYAPWPGLMPHLCDFGWSISGGPIMAAYLPWTREFGIRVIDPLHPVDYQPLRIRPIRYCPKCGEALPPSLRTEWIDRIKHYPIVRQPPDPEVDAAPPRRTPAYYCFDNWWRDKGL